MGIYTAFYKHCGANTFCMRTTHAESEEELKESMKLWDTSGMRMEAWKIIHRKPEDSIDPNSEAGKIPVLPTPISRRVSIQLKNDYIGDGRITPEIVATLRELANLLDEEPSRAEYLLLSRGGTQVNVRFYTKFADGLFDGIPEY